MLTAIRDRATGWIAWFVAALITIPMALWGINSYFEGGGEIAVASVDGEDISQYAYQENLQQQQNVARQRLGDGFDQELFEASGIPEQVLEKLIEQRLLARFVAANNFRITDDQLREIIQDSATFQVDGQFDAEQYRQILRANGFTPQSFELYQRANEAGNQLLAGITETGFATPEEQASLLSLQTQERTAKYAVFAMESVAEQIEVSDQEITDYYADNTEKYHTEERIKVDYIELSVATLATSIVLEPAAIEQHYEQTKGRYRTATSRKASHILLASAETDSAEQKAQQRALAEELVQRVEAGEDFATLAGEYSDDPGSRDNGGDLGAITRGQMVKPFEDAVFAMAEGDIVGPVETGFGYHVIMLTELREGGQQSLDQVRDQVVAELSTSQAENQFAELAEQFKNLVFEDPDNLTTAADALDLPVLQSDWFTAAQGKDIAADAAVRNAAFEPEVKEDGLVSAAIEIGFERLVAVQKADFEPVRTRALAEVREQVEKTVRQEKNQAEVLKRGTAILARLETESLDPEQWAEAMTREGLTIEDLPPVRGDYEPRLVALAQEIFTATRPQSGKVTVGGVVIGRGDYAIYALEDIAMDSTEEPDEAVKTRLESRLLAREQSDAYNQFIAYLRASADIVIYEDQL